MLSICIPIYNFDVTELVNALTEQSLKQSIPIEIVLIDDASDEDYKKINRGTCKQHTYIELEKNVGRSIIRNLFLQYTDAQNLLYIDCDSKIISESYLSTYVDALLQTKHPVICGGRIFANINPGKNYLLRWKYGIQKESKPYETRALHPNASFMTNNFLISRAILNEIKFDSRISEYGHEDTLFGFELKKNGIHIHHIENPVLNGDLETNLEFLEKTEKGILNLIKILGFISDKEGFIEDLTLLKFYIKLKNKNLTPFFRWVFLGSKPLLRYLLIHGNSNMSMFDFYKLGYLTQQMALSKNP